jgi:hypothetical protein
MVLKKEVRKERVKEGRWVLMSRLPVVDWTNVLAEQRVGKGARRARNGSKVTQLRK